MLAVSELEGLKFILNVRDAVLRYCGAQENSCGMSVHSMRASLKRAMYNVHACRKGYECVQESVHASGD